MTDFSVLFSAAGAAAWGSTSYDALRPALDTSALARVEALCPHPRGVFVAAFAYGVGGAMEKTDAVTGGGNLAQYARGEDYHVVVLRRLEPVCAALRLAFPARQFVAGTDASPLPERLAAALAGVGVRGANGLVIFPPYGSWVVLGTILTDLPLERAATPAPNCLACGKCAAACPAGAITAAGVLEEKCLSHLTQKTGTLAPAEAELVARHGLVWGCDICQTVCPYNEGAATMPLPEFCADLRESLAPEDLAGLTRRQFSEKYPARAFTWRGPEVLRRNFALQEGRELDA